MGAPRTSLLFAFSVFLVSLVVVSATDYGYDSLRASSEKMLTKVIGIQGTIYCKTGSHLIPIKGNVSPIFFLVDVNSRFYQDRFSKIQSHRQGPFRLKKHLWACLNTLIFGNKYINVYLFFENKIS